MSLFFMTDLHLGCNRSSHTTIQSKQRLKDALYQTALQALDVAKGDPVVCLGDVFNASFNSEDIILQGLEITNRCDLTLSGNHDLAGREGRLSSLGLLAHQDKSIIMADTSSIRWHQKSYPEADVYIVPHVANQELFEHSLDRVQQERTGAKTAILCLHSNYASPFTEGQDSSLNLTTERAEQLLKVFTYVLLGHEHTPRNLYDGRLTVLGNTHPTSFSDISSKYVWEFNGRTFIKHMIWNKDKGYAELEWQDLTPVAVNDKQFVSITGQAKAEEAPQISKAIFDAWKFSPNLLMLRNNVQYEGAEVNPASTTELLDIPTRINAALKDSELLPLWLKYVEGQQ